MKGNVTVRSPPAASARAKTARGAAVVKKVIRHATALLSEQPSREVTVAEIARRARIPRASLLLQFPGGLHDVLAAIATEETTRIVEVARETIAAKRAATTTRLVYIWIDAIAERARATGLLYGNILIEALNSVGTHREEFRASLGMLGLEVVAASGADLPPEEFYVDAKLIALGEMLVRAAWINAALPAATSSLLDRGLGLKYSDEDQLAHTLADALSPIIRQRGIALGRARPGQRRRPKGG